MKPQLIKPENSTLKLNNQPTSRPKIDRPSDYIHHNKKIREKL